MFCEPCRRERPSSRYCVLCGTALVSRPKHEVEVHLEKVRWLIDEVSLWDESLASGAARMAIREYYGRQEGSLLETLNPKPPPSPVKEVKETEVVIISSPLPRGERETVVEPPPPPPRPSRWQLTWKPFPHESLGWFLGKFLILSGALYLVRDAWSSMDSSLRALTVFGLVEVWAIGFSLWAAALSKKDTTRSAAVGLRRIAALVAPLAVLTLGTALDSVFSWIALLGGTALAGFLAHRAAEDLEEPAPILSASVSLATLGLGLAPVLPVASGWLALVPAALAAIAFKSGPRQSNGHTVRAMVAFGLPVAAVVARFLVSELHASGALAALWVSAAMLASAALWLRAGAPRSPTLSPLRRERGLQIVAMATFAVAFLASFFSAAPACVLIAVLGVWTTVRLSRELPAGARTHWWLAGTYGFAYLAWQRVDQLVPAIVWTWWDQLKVALGYAAAPMPASYASVYQSLFIAAGALIAGWHWHRSPKTERNLAAHVWLRCSSIAAVAAGALAMVSVHFDARPAVVALPSLALPLLAVGIAARRPDALAGGSVLSVLFALASGLLMPPGWPAAAVAVALALGAHALPMVRETRVLRRWLAGAALCAAGVAFVLAAPTGGSVALTTLILGSVARWNSALPAVAATAFIGPLWSLAVPATHSVELVPCIVLAVVAGLAALPLPRLWWTLALASGALLGFLLPSWSPTVAPGWAWLLSAGAWLLLATREPAKPRGWLEAPALVSLVVATSPFFGLWASWSHAAALCCAGGFALAASVHAVRKGRGWQSVLLSLLAVGSALATLDLGLSTAAACAAVVLLATPALLPSITVPFATLLLGIAWAAGPEGLVLLAVATALVALLEEHEWSSRHLLNRSSVTWAATVTSIVTLLVARVVTTGPSVLLTVVAVLLPLVWTRATRRAELLAPGLCLIAAAGPWWLAPIFAVAAGRLLELAPVRAVFALPEAHSKARREVEELALFIAAAAAGGVSVALQPEHALAWFPALLLMGGSLPALRLVVAVAIAVPLEPLRSPVVGLLVALAAAAQHVPAQLKRVLGLRSLQYVEPVALLLAMVGAAALALVAPSSASPLAFPFAVGTVALLSVLKLRQPSPRPSPEGRGRGIRAVSALACTMVGGTVALLAPQWMLPVTLGVTAVLLGVPALFSAAIVCAGLDLNASLRLGELIAAPALFPVAMLAALLAVALQWKELGARASELWRWLGREADTPLPSALFWGALGLGCLMLWSHDPRALWLAPLLLVTPRQYEAAAGLLLSALAATVLLPPSLSVPLAGAGALGFAYAGTRFTQWRVAIVWRHASWLLALLGIGLAGLHLDSPLVPLAWSVGAATTWLLLREHEEAQGWAWVATGVAMHVVMAFVGVVLDTGAPKVLILPWWAAGMAALALVRQLRGGRSSVYAFGWIALTELLLGVTLLASAQPREAVLCVGVALVLAYLGWRRVVEEDEGSAGWLLQCALIGGGVAARVLGLGAMPELTDAWVLLGVSALVAGLAQYLGREGRVSSARALRLGALLWPMLGAVLVPWRDWNLGAGWLLGLSALAAWLARSGSKRVGSILSALALNAAVLLAAVGSGFGQLQLLLIPLGLSLLALAHVFSDELDPGAMVKLRAWGMGLMYVGVAWSPLTVTSIPALLLCVLVCLGGVALGALWRIRSYVVLGSGVLVTTVLATLVRSGLAEPRLGAVFLSLLGLIVVVVMVMISTRREELQARLAAMQRAMASWEA